MMTATAVLLVVFLLAPVDAGVKPNVDIFTTSGPDLVINELFLLAAAGLGATFAGLFKAYRYIGKGTYDPKYESSYWIRIVLGLIAGIILGSLVPIKSSTGTAGALSKPFLALIGGFSASVLFRILNRAVGTLESLVQGESDDDDGASKRLAHAEATAQQVKDQMVVSAGLVKLREQVSAGVTHEELASNLNRLLEEFLPVELAPDQPRTS